MQLIRIHINAVGDPPPVKTVRLEGEAVFTDCSILEKGTEQGKTSLYFIVNTPEGDFWSVQMTAALFKAINSAIDGAEERWKLKGN